MQNRIFSKPRVDRWDNCLTEAERWQIYERSQKQHWSVVRQWMMEEYPQIGEPPSKSAFYRWQRVMREGESAHRLESALIAREEANALVSAVTDDQTLIDAYKTLAQDLALKGDADSAAKYCKMAISLAERLTKNEELELKKEKLALDKEMLKLNREKFEAQEERERAACAALKETDISPEEREARLKQIFHIT